MGGPEYPQQKKDSGEYNDVVEFLRFKKKYSFLKRRLFFILGYIQYKENSFVLVNIPTELNSICVYSMVD
jgi:hypothetical protein